MSLLWSNDILTFMETELSITPKKRGQQLQNAERLIVIAKLVEELSNGYMSTYALSKKLRLNRATIEAYRPLADKLITETRLDRGVIRNLQVRRTYKLIEMLMDDLKKIDSTPLDVSTKMATKSKIYSQIAKFSQHLALITGLNVETQVNVNPKQLVIIRANNHKRPKTDIIDQPSPESVSTTEATT